MFILCIPKETTNVLICILYSITNNKYKSMMLSRKLALCGTICTVL